MQIPITLVYEDDLSEMVMLRMLDSFENKFHVVESYNTAGFGKIKTSIRGFNKASRHTTFFVLTDLDNTNCPIDLINEWLPDKRNDNLIFRVAVREVESWILADRDGLSNFLNISLITVPLLPDLEPDPKKSLLKLVSKSRNRQLKNDILPKNEFASIGPNYNGRMGEFVQNIWNLNNAINHSASFKRAMHRLENYKFVSK